MTLPRILRPFLVLCGLFLLAACDAHDAGEPPRPMGNFALGLNIVVADTAQTLPISRQAKPEEWKAVMTKAMADRFGSYSGDKLFDFGISIDGYLLAPPGVPIVASPHSALIFTVNVWDDAKQELLVKGGKRMTYVEGVSAESVIGSGWTQSKDVQMKKLAFNAAKMVQNYMLEHPEWLGLTADQVANPPANAATTAAPATAAPATTAAPVATPAPVAATAPAAPAPVKPAPPKLAPSKLPPRPAEISPLLLLGPSLP
jgi:hypothetical protein